MVISGSTHIRAASFSVFLNLFDTSSVLAIIVYITLILASIQSVSLVTAFLYTSTLSAVIEEICGFKQISRVIFGLNQVITPANKC